MHSLSRFAQPLALLMGMFVLSACGGGGSSGSATTFTVEGRVLNGVLVGSAVEIFGSNGERLATATTDTDGRYSAEASQDGPYRLRATGGKLNGVDYAGVLEASCAGGSSCFVTPYTTVLLRLVDDYGFNTGDGAALLANSLGFDGDPFAEDVPAVAFDLDATRQAIAGGDGLDAWVESMAEWVTDKDAAPPPGVVTSDPADPVSYTVSTSAGPGGSLEPANRTVGAGETAAFTVVPDTGYSIDQVTGCGGSLAGGVYIIGAVTASCTVNATFSLNAYTVTTAAGVGGSIVPATRTVSHGQATSFTVTPDGGYSINQVSGCNGSLDGTLYTTGAITAACEVVATFSLGVSATVTIKISVIVTSDGDPVPTLGAEDFTVKIGDQKVPLAGDFVAVPPSQDSGQRLSLMLVMDFTESIRNAGALEPLQNATSAFVKQLSPGDVAGIIKFNNRQGSRVVLPFTEIVDPVTTAATFDPVIYAPYDGGGTPLFDAIQLAVDTFKEPGVELPPGPKAIIVTADGEDSDSDAQRLAVAQAARDNKTPIFTIGLGDVNDDSEWLNNLQQLAALSGGTYNDATVNPETAIEEAYGAVSASLKNQYVLTFDYEFDDCSVLPLTIEIEGVGSKTTTFLPCTDEGTPLEMVSLQVFFDL